MRVDIQGQRSVFRTLTKAGSLRAVLLRDYLVGVIRIFWHKQELSDERVLAEVGLEDQDFLTMKYDELHGWSESQLWQRIRSYL